MKYRFEIIRKDPTYLTFSAFKPQIVEYLFLYNEQWGGSEYYYVFVKPEIHQWFKDNNIFYTIGQYKDMNRYLEFEKLDDLLLFKLTWVGL